MKKEITIKRKEEFTRIIKAHRSFGERNMVLYYQPKAETVSRIGISVTTKLGNAVQRNRAKRQLRAMIDEIFKGQEDFDAVIVIKASFKDDSYSVNKKYLESCYKKVKISGVKG